MGYYYYIKQEKIIFIIFVFYMFFVDSYMNSKDWSKRLNNTFIDNNNKHGCYIKITKICPYKIGKYVFDLTKWKNLKCSENKENTKNFPLQISESQYINENTKRFGFPLIYKSPDLLVNFNEHNNKVTNYIKKNLVDMDNMDLLN